jgi:hypothetical protein
MLLRLFSVFLNTQNLAYIKSKGIQGESIALLGELLIKNEENVNTRNSVYLKSKASRESS